MGALHEGVTVLLTIEHTVRIRTQSKNCYSNADDDSQDEIKEKNQSIIILSTVVLRNCVPFFQFFMFHIPTLFYRIGKRRTSGTLFENSVWFLITLLSYYRSISGCR